MLAGSCESFQPDAPTFEALANSKKNASVHVRSYEIVRTALGRRRGGGGRFDREKTLDLPAMHAWEASSEPSRRLRAV